MTQPVPSLRTPPPASAQPATATATATDRQHARPLVLASTSKFRAALLARLGIDFVQRAPVGADETPKSGELIPAMVERLARAKAEAVVAAGSLPADALVIGSDQSAEVEGRILHKPGGFERAREQLRALSGKTVTFHTGLALYDTASDAMRSCIVPFSVSFRNLDDALIERYLHAEEPYQSVGAFQSEGMGIVLFERLAGDDPNTLIGLPLIRLTDWLLDAGCSPIATAPTRGSRDPADAD